MTSTRSSQLSFTAPSRSLLSDSPGNSMFRRRSTTGFGSTSSTSSLTHSPPSGTSPRVQLVPYVHRLSYDSNLSQCEKEVLDSTSFDAFDLSSKDFDFEDIFTYDKPQRKLPSVVEVTSSSHSTSVRDKDCSNFSFSHYNASTAIRQKVNKGRPGIGEMYVKNKSDASRKR